MARERKFKTGRQGLFAALDVGTSKISCLIARAEAPSESNDSGIRILGAGLQLSEGVRQGAIVDMAAAEAAIRAAVDSAERMADVTVEDVLLAFTTGQPASEHLSVEVPIQGNEVRDADVRRVLQQGRLRAEQADRDPVHAIPVTYSIDGGTGIREPRGMYGEKLGVLMHVVTAAQAPLRNLIVCVERCHLRVIDHVVAPYASALSALVEDEMDLGVTCVDLGAGTTSIAVFRYGRLVSVDVVPCGGGHVTMDLAHGLASTLADAERMKTLYGTALSSPTDEREMISFPTIGEEGEEPNRVPRAVLTGIIRPRLEETLEFVRERLAALGVEKLAGRRVVLTGGASQMNGIRELSGRILDRPVRLSAPARLPGMAMATSGPAFASVVGLLHYAVRKPHEAAFALRSEFDRAPTPPLSRIGRWLRENF